MLLYPIGIPVILLACLLRLDLPRLARYGKGEAIFQQLVGIYIKQRDESVCSRIATYIGGHKDVSQPQVNLTERAAQLHREVSGNGEHAVTSTRFLDWLARDVTEDDREEMAQIFAHFDDDGNEALDEEEMLGVFVCVCVCVCMCVCVCYGSRGLPCDAPSCSREKRSRKGEYLCLLV